MSTDHATDRRPPVDAPPPTVSRRRSLPSLHLLANRYAIVGVWAAMAVVYAVLVPDKFLRASTFQSIFGSQQALVFLAMAALCTLVVGEIDLSLASILGLSATIVPVLVGQHGVSTPVACLVAIAACVLCGCLNAFVVVGIGVDALVVTLGTGTFLMGIASLIANQTTVFGLSPEFGKLALLDVGGLPISFYYGLAVAIAFAYVLSFTPLGRHMTFIGANAEVARLAGVSVNRTRVGAYIAGGAFAGIGGVVLVSSVGGYDPSSSPQYLLPMLASVFLGTAVVRPGRFNPIGTLIGIYFLATGILGLQLLGYNGWIENAFYGAALVTSVAVATVVHRRGAAA